jgi:hypothetical protein
MRPMTSAASTLDRTNSVPVRGHPFTALGQVANIDAVVDALAAKKIATERYPGMDQDARGIWRSPSGARVAWFKDPDGNKLSLTQR